MLDVAWQWMLLGLPIAFALGWIGSRLDLRQWRRESRDSPRAYYKGLNLLLNEQQDKAIDAFIEAVQNDPETAELHFALGNLFRRRGEFERSVRVHQHLLQRADLPSADRDRAQHALAQDFAKAGLFDRAEAAYRALEGTAFETESRLALLGLYERTRDWARAIEIAAKLEPSGRGSFASRVSHFWCELALEADAAKQPDEAQRCLDQAMAASQASPRPWVIAGQRLSREGDARGAVERWLQVLRLHPTAASLVARDLATSARHAGCEPEVLAALQALPPDRAGHDITSAIGLLLRESDAEKSQRLTQQLALVPTLTSAAAVLRDVPPNAWSDATRDVMSHAVERAAKPLQRYRCAACGFEAQHYFWQCPGCLGWDSFPPLRIEEQ
jgi:lipopolysaccharide assembly protein B